MILSILLSLTAVQILSYVFVLWLLATATGHGFEAAGVVRPMRPLLAALEAIAQEVEGGLDGAFACGQAEAAARGTVLQGLFEIDPQLRLAFGVSERVEHYADCAFGALLESVLANEAMGPRIGLALTALAIYARFAGVPGAHFESVGAAVVTTGAGMTVAIIEAFNHQRVLAPAMRRLRPPPIASWPPAPGRQMPRRLSFARL